MADKPCPENHSPYQYQHLAEVAAQLHVIAYPRCPGFHAFACKGGTDAPHWHIGHDTKTHGDTCKTVHPTDRRRGVVRFGRALDR